MKAHRPFRHGEDHLPAVRHPDAIAGLEAVTIRRKRGCSAPSMTSIGTGLRCETRLDAGKAIGLRRHDPGHAIADIKDAVRQHVKVAPTRISIERRQLRTLLHMQPTERGPRGTCRRSCAKTRYCSRRRSSSDSALKDLNGMPVYPCCRALCRSSTGRSSGEVGFA